jgi:acetyl-CoA acetyltransferase
MSQDNATIVIASAARTPVGSFNGSLAPLSAHELGSLVMKAAMERAGVQPGDVLAPAYRSIPLLGSLIRSAARACARWRWACSRLRQAPPPSSSPAVRRA